MKYLSASSLSTFVKCPRVAVLEGAGLKTGPSKAQERGTRLHAALEEYLLGNTGDVIEDDLGDHARTNGLLPAPGDPHILVEYGIGDANRDAARYAETTRWTGRQIELAGFPFRGIVDLVRLDRGGLEIWDHKTVGSWYYAETNETLRQNLQAWSYAEQIAAWLEDENMMPSGPIVIGHLQYRKSRNPKPDDVRKVSFRTSRAEVARKWKMIEEIAEAFRVELDRAFTDVPPHRNHCAAYGGCRFESFCSKVPRRDLRPETLDVVDQWNNDR